MYLTGVMERDTMYRKFTFRGYRIHLVRRVRIKNDEQHHKGGRGGGKSVAGGRNVEKGVRGLYDPRRVLPSLYTMTAGIKVTAVFARITSPETRYRVTSLLPSLSSKTSVLAEARHKEPMTCILQDTRQYMYRGYNTFSLVGFLSLPYIPDRIGAQPPYNPLYRNSVFIVCIQREIIQARGRVVCLYGSRDSQLWTLIILLVQN